MNLKKFDYNGVQLSEACWIKGTPYFTRRAIGEWLGAEHPRQYVGNIVKRNPYIRDYSVVLNLRTTDGKKYDTEAYDPIGMQLIIMESHLPKAIRYKVAVAKLVHDMMTGKFLTNLVTRYVSGEIDLW